MTDAVEVTLSHRRTKGERRQKVLQHLAGMLNEATLEKITTARIAEVMDISEGLLYRYFKNKADMFDSLIDFAEESLMGLTGQIRASEGMSGLDQVRASVNVMLQFADANPGITRVMTGQVLIYEDPRLIERVSRLHLALEAGLKLSYRTSVAEGALPADFDASGRASLLMASVLGQWQRFVLTGFKVRPGLKSSSDTELFLKP